MRRKPLTDNLRAKAKLYLHQSGEVAKTRDGQFFVRLQQVANAVLLTDGGIAEFDPALIARARESLTRRNFLLDRISPGEYNKVRLINEANALLGLERVENELLDLGEQLLSAAEDADAKRLEALLAQGAPVNYPDPRIGATALHYIAAQGARRALRVLLKSKECDFLAIDHRGRLAAELAGFAGRDLPMERLLLKNAIRQARAKGIPIEEIYRRDGLGRPALSS